MTNLPIALIEVKSMEDIAILIHADPTLEDVDDEVDQFMQIMQLSHSNVSDFDDLLELWGFWVSDENRESLLRGVFQYEKLLS